MTKDSSASRNATRIADDPLATIKRRARPSEVKDSEVLWLVAEVDDLRAKVNRPKEAGLPDNEREVVQQIIEEALTTDGAHRKNWYLTMIAQYLKLPIRVANESGIFYPGY